VGVEEWDQVLVVKQLMIEGLWFEDVAEGLSQRLMVKHLMIEGLSFEENLEV